jgi:hypothetical protein
MVVKALVLESDDRCLVFFRNVLHHGKAPLRVARDTGARKCSVASHENGSGGNVGAVQPIGRELARKRMDEGLSVHLAVEADKARGFARAK